MYPNDRDRKKTVMLILVFILFWLVLFLSFSVYLHFFVKFSYFSIALTPMGMLNASQQLNDDRWKYFHCIGLFRVVLFRFMCAFHGIVQNVLMRILYDSAWSRCRHHMNTGQCLNLYFIHGMLCVCCSLFSIGLSLLLFLPPSFSLSLFLLHFLSPSPSLSIRSKTNFVLSLFRAESSKNQNCLISTLFNRELKLGLSFIQLIVLFRCAMCMHIKELK